MNLKKFLPLIAGVGVLFLMYVSMIIFSHDLAPEVVNVYTGKHLQENVVQKNLSLPFPNMDNFLGLTDEQMKEVFIHKNFPEFYELVQKNYIYTTDEFDYKYWSYVWTLWWAENQEKHDFKIDYIQTKNHVFVMFSNEDGYCTADKNILDCRGIDVESYGAIVTK